MLIGYMEVKMSWHLVRWPGKLKLAFVSESVLVFVPPQSSLSAFRRVLSLSGGLVHGHLDAIVATSHAFPDPLRERVT